ncbi:MAG: TonB family protein [Taibaiella sp.]|nr:TonB family protein [Taibaiella sp.]
MLFLIQYTAYSALLFGIYILFLRNRELHSWNRFFLIAIPTLSLALPLIKLPVLATQVPALAYTLPEIAVSPLNKVSNSSFFSLPSLVLAAYVAISAVLLSRIAIQYFAIEKRKKRSSYQLQDGVRVFTETGIGPGSLGRDIFFPGTEVAPEILEHEMTHVRLHHTADMALLHLLQAIFWPNIVLHFIGRELRMVHEFQADAEGAIDAEHYSAILLAESMGVKHGTLEHTFFHHPIKRRIVMLQKKKDSRRPLIPAAIRSGFATLLVAAGIIWLQSCTRKAMPEPAAYATAEKMPHTDYDLGTYLGNNIKYPEDARKRNVEGRVIVKFIVDKDGSVTKPEVLRSPDQALSDEAIRVVSTMPKWQPAMNGNKTVPVYFVLPISFQLAPNAATAPQKG